MKTIVITDLTRFRKPDTVCIAGVSETGGVIRPMPYLSAQRCRELNVHPGGILRGRFDWLWSSDPHVEDASYEHLRYGGAGSAEQLRDALRHTMFDGIARGFEFDLPRDQKWIPLENPPPRSLITVTVDPSKLFFIWERANPSASQTLKVHFEDRCGTRLSYVAVTDRDFHDYFQRRSPDAQHLAQLRSYLQQQEEVYLRLGLSRAYRAPDGRSGYWIHPC